MKKVTVEVLSGPSTQGNAHLLFPNPFNDGFVEVTSVGYPNKDQNHKVKALNSQQTAYWVEYAQDQPLPTIEYSFDETTTTEFNEESLIKDFWSIQSNRYTTASAELCESAKELVSPAQPAHEKIRTLINHAAELFDYGHQDVRFNDGATCVPNICGTAKGSCVDINTYLIAAARSVDIPVQYIAGYWFHPERNFTHDMHCWLAFKADDDVLFWDLAHHIKWGVGELNPGLNPAGGRRVPMSYGRGISFNTHAGTVAISHFSEPVWVLADGSLESPEVIINIDEF